MTIRKSLTAILAAGMLLSQSVRAAAAAPIQNGRPEILSQQALQSNQYIAAGSANQKVIAPMAFGFIYESTTYASVGAGGLYLTTRTTSRSTVRKIGVKNVRLQYSANGQTNWINVAYLGDFLNSNSSMHRITNKFVPSTNGAGYYRIALDHVAYNNAADPQTISKTTEAYWLYY